MLSRYLTLGALLCALSAAVWGALQARRVADLSTRLLDAERRVTESVAAVEAARRTVATMEAHMQTLRRQAAEAEQLRAQIEEQDDETPVPAWLADLPRRLREAADRAATAHP